MSPETRAHNANTFAEQLARLVTRHLREKGWTPPVPSASDGEDGPDLITVLKQALNQDGGECPEGWLEVPVLIATTHRTIVAFDDEPPSDARTLAFETLEATDGEDVPVRFSRVTIRARKPEPHDELGTVTAEAADG